MIYRYIMQGIYRYSQGQFLQKCINFSQLNAFLLLTIIYANTIDPLL